MTSKRRLRRKSCTGKEQLTEAEAKRKIYFMAKGGAKYLNAYKCRFCKHYHIGHMPKRVRQAMKARRRVGK